MNGEMLETITSELKPTPAPKHRWREIDLEKWIEANPHLPTGERLLVVARQRALKQSVDVVCLDKDARIVLVEIKNERTGRSLFGQVFEYLADLSSFSWQELEVGLIRFGGRVNYAA